jgi:hypothetical protein
MVTGVELSPMALLSGSSSGMVSGIRIFSIVLLHLPPVSLNKKASGKLYLLLLPVNTPQEKYQKVPPIRKTGTFPQSY